MNALPIIIRDTTLPVHNGDIQKMAEHVVDYHNHWNRSMVPLILEQYPEDDYNNNLERAVDLGTDFLFRCGTRDSARAFSAAGVPTYMYLFNFHELYDLFEQLA